MFMHTMAIVAGNGLGGAMRANKNTTYHTPPPRFEISFTLKDIPQRDEAVILSQMFWGTPPPPLLPAPRPPQTQPPPPPPPP